MIKMWGSTFIYQTSSTSKSSSTQSKKANKKNTESKNFDIQNYIAYIHFTDLYQIWSDLSTTHWDILPKLAKYKKISENQNFLFFYPRLFAKDMEVRKTPKV